MIGASPALLTRLGYLVHRVPSVDARIDACVPLVGKDQVQCWAALDQYLMEQVVPWVPYVFEHYVRTIGPRIDHYSFDQSVAMPAFDRISLKGG
jgi:hypothetical protein